MTDAKAGKDVPTKTCKNPVDQHMPMGELVGLSGTPSWSCPTAGMLPGYVPAERLKLILAEHAVRDEELTESPMAPAPAPARTPSEPVSAPPSPGIAAR